MLSYNFAIVSREPPPRRLASVRSGAAGRRSHHVDAAPTGSRRPLAAVAEAAVIGGRSVHVRRLQLHLAGGDGGVQLDLSPVHDVEHQADADDDLQRTRDKNSNFVEDFVALRNMLTCTEYLAPPYLYTMLVEIFGSPQNILQAAASSPKHRSNFLIPKLKCCWGRGNGFK